MFEVIVHTFNGVHIFELYNAASHVNAVNFVRSAFPYPIVKIFCYPRNESLFKNITPN